MYALLAPLSTSMSVLYAVTRPHYSSIMQLFFFWSFAASALYMLHIYVQRQHIIPPSPPFDALNSSASLFFSLSLSFVLCAQDINVDTYIGQQRNQKCFSTLLLVVRHTHYFIYHYQQKTVAAAAVSGRRARKNDDDSHFPSAGALASGIDEARASQENSARTPRVLQPAGGVERGKVCVDALYFRKRWERRCASCNASEGLGESLFFFEKNDTGIFRGTAETHTA